MSKKHRSEGGAPSDEGSAFLQYGAIVLQKIWNQNKERGFQKCLQCWQRNPKNAPVGFCFIEFPKYSHSKIFLRSDSESFPAERLASSRVDIQPPSVISSHEEEPENNRMQLPEQQKQKKVARRTQNATE